MRDSVRVFRFEQSMNSFLLLADEVVNEIQTYMSTCVDV